MKERGRSVETTVTSRETSVAIVLLGVTDEMTLIRAVANFRAVFRRCCLGRVATSGFRLDRLLGRRALLTERSIGRAHLSNAR